MEELASNREEIYNPFNVMKFTYDSCFLCGSSVGGDRTVEHVFPKWLLHRHDLWNQKITLLNGTKMPYRELTVPCCQQCNNESLSSLELMMQKALNKGYQEIRSVDPLVIYQWVAKIFYGILFKELSLLAERKDPTKGTITDPEMLERYSVIHMFLQSTRMPFEFHGFRPWSLFVVEILDNPEEGDFDYLDDLGGPLMALQTNGVGIIAVLDDGGAQELRFNEFLGKFDGVKLHPIQFLELVTMVQYGARLLNRVPKYMFTASGGDSQKRTVISLPLQGFSSKPIFDEWDQREFAAFLSRNWAQFGFEYTDIYKEGGLVFSLLINEAGDPIILDRYGSRTS